MTALGRTADARVPELLLRGWKGHSPQVRGAILDALLARESWTIELLSTLADGRVPPADIDPARRQRLLTHRKGELKARAEALFSHQATSRQRVVDAYRPALGLKGKPDAGAPLFKKLCASCHRLGTEGVEVGPDLATLNDKSPEALLIAILDPNRAFESKYAGFTVATDDGRVLSGLIAGETASAVTLRRQEGRDVVLLRSQIDEMAGSGQSLMPEGIEKDLTPQELADLIAFLGEALMPAGRAHGTALLILEIHGVPHRVRPTPSWPATPAKCSGWRRPTGSRGDWPREVPKWPSGRPVGQPAGRPLIARRFSLERECGTCPMRVQESRRGPGKRDPRSAGKSRGISR